MTNMRNGDSDGLQRMAFPRMYQAVDECRLTSDVRQRFASFVESMDLSWMLDAKKLAMLCTNTLPISEAGVLQPVHGLLLAKKSLFFDAMLRYSRNRDLQLPFEQFDFLQRCVTTIIEYINNDEQAPSIRDDNCLDLYRSADFLLYGDLKEKVLAYIKKACATNLELALHIWTFTEGCYQPDLGKLVLDQLLCSFNSVIQEPLWLDLEYGLVRKLLMHSGINCSSELSVLEAASRWLRANSAERAGCGEGLLVCVRRGLLSQAEAVALLQHDTMSWYPNLLAMYRGFPYLPEEAAERYAQFTDALALAATPRDPHEAVMLFGGWCQEDGPRAACQVFNPRANTWTMWSPNAALPSACIGQVERRVYAGCILVNDILHLVGGFDGERALNTVSCYHLSSPGRGWYEGSCMISKRYYVCCAAMDGHIYAIGGHSGETQERYGGRLDTVEWMDVQDNTWIPVASMRTVRSDAGAAALGGRVYVVGGFNGQQYHDTAEMYEPGTNQWTFISRMNFLRGGVSLVALGDALYAIGGNDGQTRLAVVESYQHEYDGWVFSGRLTRQKSNLSTAVIENGVMVMGGWSDQPTVGILSAVEKFTPSTETSVQLADMSYAASATSACTVIGRDLVARYLTAVTYPVPWLLGAVPITVAVGQDEQPPMVADGPVPDTANHEMSTETNFIQSSQDTDLDP